ncbi:MAG: 1-deoxy-D-xylulose-5-phosphate reductoisomerase [Firmicutes bacterium]|nr:1-deoxy-D-xylulose-5-phosphate reductoisomerase [Bacillota bacterium]
MKRIAILGSTGSIGKQALQVIPGLASEFKVAGLAAGSNKELALQQVKEFVPEVVSLAKEEDAHWLQHNLGPELGTTVVWGIDGLVAVATLSGVDTVLTAVSGAVGLLPTVKAIKAGKDIALANKETLVAAGPLVMDLARAHGTRLLPVDSEHSAIWQCLQGENAERVSKIILTASGGPFRTFDMDLLKQVTPGQALKHPNWDMGGKITIDSATLMNKGLEIIEARWLFGLDYENIEVTIHPQSIIHSMVEFVDGSIIAQLGVPDMRLPIQYALTHPQRVKGSAPRLSWPIGDLSFEAPDYGRFPCLHLAYEAGRIGGTMPAVLNAANEIAVEQFITGRIGFMSIPSIVAKAMEKHTVIQKPSLDQIFEADRWAREMSISYA